MPGSFADVYDTYRRVQSDPMFSQLNLRDFARMSNALTDSQDYSSGDEGMFLGGVKRGSYWLDKGLNATGIPDVVGSGTGALFSALGANPETGRELGHGLLRTTTDFAPMIAAGVLAPEVTIPALLASGALGAANAYEKTDSGVAAAIGGAMPFVGSAGSAIAGRVLSQEMLPALAAKLPWIKTLGLGTGAFEAPVATAAGEAVQPFVLRSAADKAANVLAGQAGATVAMEGLNAFNGGLEQWKEDPWTAFMGATVGNLPFMGHDLLRSMKPMVTGTRPFEDPPSKTPVTPIAPAEVSPVHRQAAARDMEYQKRVDAINKLPSNIERIDALQSLDEEFGFSVPLAKKQTFDNKMLGNVPLSEAQKVAKVTFKDSPLVKLAQEKFSDDPVLNRIATNQAEHDLGQLLHEKAGLRTEYDRAVSYLKSEDPVLRAQGETEFAQLSIKFQEQKAARVAAAQEALKALPREGELTLDEIKTDNDATATIAHANTIREYVGLHVKGNEDIAEQVAAHVEAGDTVTQATAKTAVEFMNSTVRQLKERKGPGRPAGPSKRSQQRSVVWQMYEDRARMNPQDAEAQSVVATINEVLKRKVPVAQEQVDLTTRIANAVADWHDSSRTQGVKFGEQGELFGLPVEDRVQELGKYLSSALTKHVGKGRPLTEWRNADGDLISFDKPDHPDALAAMERLNANEGDFESPGTWRIEKHGSPRKDGSYRYTLNLHPTKGHVPIEDPAFTEAVNKAALEMMPEGDLTDPDYQMAVDTSKEDLIEVVLQKSDSELIEGFVKASKTKQPLAWEKGLRELAVAKIKEGDRQYIANVIADVAKSGATFQGALGERLLTSSPGEHLDLRPTWDNVVDRVLEKQGWTTEQRAQAKPFFEMAKKVAGLDQVAWGELLNDVQGKKAVLGLASMDRNEGLQAFLAANEHLAKKSKTEQAHNLAFVGAHEASHLVRRMAEAGMLDAEGQAAWASFEKMARAPEHMPAETLQLMAEGLLPKEIRESEAIAQMLKTTDPEEFMATAQAVWSMGQVKPHVDAEVATAMMPQGVRAWMQTLGRYARELWGAVKSAFIMRPEQAGVQSRDGVKDLVKNIASLRKSVNNASERIAEFQSLMNVDSNSFKLLRTSAMRMVDDNTASVGVRDLAKLASVKFDEKDSKLDKVGRAVSEFFVPMEQLAETYPEIAPMAHALLRAPMEEHQSLTRALAPTHGGFDPARGDFTFRGEAYKDRQIIENSNKAERTLSRIKTWWNEQLAKPVDKRQKLDLLHPEAELQRMLDTLTPRERQAVINMHERMNEGMQMTNETIKTSVREMEQYGVAMYLAKHATDYSQGKRLAELLWNASELGNADALATQQMIAEVVAQVPDFKVRANAMKSVMEGRARVAKLSEFFDSRPGFSSERRVGQVFIRAIDANGNQIGALGFANKGDSKIWVDEIKKANPGATFKTEQSTGGARVIMDTELVDALTKTEEGLKRRLSTLIDDPQVLAEALEGVDLLGEMRSSEAAKTYFEQGSNRRLAEGREHLNMLETQEAYIRAVSKRMANSLMRSRMALELNNPKVKERPDLVAQVKQGALNYLTPDSPIAQAVMRFNAVYFLGGNIPGHMAEFMQPLFTVVPQMRAEGVGYIKAAKMLKGVMGDLLNFYVTGKGDLNKWKDRGEARMLADTAEKGLHGLGHLAELQERGVESAIDSRLLPKKGKLATAGEMATKPVKWWADTTMNLYRMFTKNNAKISLLLGYRMARAKGMDPIKATEDAIRFNLVTTGSSGRAGRPVTPYKGGNMFGPIALSLQRYAMLNTAMLGRFIKHGTFGKDLNLTPKQKSDARAAAAGMMGVQFAAAGALGLPFMGAAATLLEQMAGVDVKGTVYEKLGSMLDEDDKDGGILGDIIMRGAANAMMDRLGVPVDVGSRFSVGGLPGLSEMEGISSDSIWGATGSMVRSMAHGAKALASDGNILGAIKAVAPPSLRKAIDLYANGDATTQAGRGLGINEDEKFLYSLGFTPSRLRKLRDFDRMQTHNEEIRSKKEARTVAQIVDLYNSNPQLAAMRLEQLVRSSQGMEDRQELARKVADKVAESKFGPVDPRRTGTKKGAEESMLLMRGMGLPLESPQEMARLRERMDVMRMLGVSPSGLLRSSRGASRFDTEAQDDPFTAFRR